MSKANLAVTVHLQKQMLIKLTPPEVKNPVYIISLRNNFYTFQYNNIKCVLFKTCIGTSP